MRIVKIKKEIEKVKAFFRVAAEEAQHSTCLKSQRGAVIVKGGEIIGRGYNKVTIPELCNPCIRENIKDNSRVELCSAIHAEQMAIIDAAEYGEKSLFGATMFHIKLKNGQIRPSGKPSCTVCSRILSEAKIKFVLWHQDEKGEYYAVYSPEELNRLSFDYFLKGGKR
jgi:dCMP deaminase